MILRQVLQEIEAVEGGISVRELSQRLDVDVSAVEGMLEFLVRKGRLVDDSLPVSELSGGCGQPLACASACPGATSCPFITMRPKTYSLKKRVTGGE